jgi:hypothetical protein
VVLTSRTWRSGSPLTSGLGVTWMWGLRRETYVAVRVTLWCTRDGSNKRKSGWVMAYLGSFTLTSCMSTMSVVGPAVFSSIVRVVVLRFVLWDMIWMVAADELYLFISSHGSVSDKVGFGRDVFEGDCLRSCFLLGFSYCVDFNGASGVVCSMLGTFSYTEYNRASRTSWTWYATPRERGNAHQTVNTTTPNRNPPQHTDNYRKNDVTHHRPMD